MAASCGSLRVATPRDSSYTVACLFGSKSQNAVVAIQYAVVFGQVTVFDVRDPGEPRVTAVVGDLRDRAQVEAAVQGVPAHLCVLVTPLSSMGLN